MVGTEISLKASNMRRALLFLRKICLSKCDSILITDDFDETTLPLLVEQVAIERILKAMDLISYLTVAEGCRKINIVQRCRVVNGGKKS